MFRAHSTYADIVIIHLIPVVLLAIIATIGVEAIIATPTLAQSVTSSNTTGGNSTESLTTHEG